MLYCQRTNVVRIEWCLWTYRTSPKQKTYQDCSTSFPLQYFLSYWSIGSGIQWDLGLIPDQYIWDFLWTEWHWDKLLPECRDFPVSSCYHRCCIRILYSSAINAILSYSLLAPSNKLIVAIPGFRLKVDEICDFLRYYAEYSCNSLQMFHDGRSFKRRYIVSKRRQGITSIRCVSSQKSSHLKTLLPFPQIFYYSLETSWY